MRFSALVLSGVLALAAAQDTASTTVSLTPAQESQAACLKKCKSGDVGCQALCVGVPNPDENQVNANTKCSEKCPQGDGSPAATEEFGQCLAKCRGEHYFTSGGIAKATVVADVSSAVSSALGAASSAASAAASVASSIASEASAAVSSAVSQASASGSAATQTSGSSQTSAAAASGSSAASSTSKGLAPAMTAAPAAVLGLVAAVLAL